MCQCLPSPKNMFKKVPDLAAKAIWFMTNYVVYLNKCAHTVKSLNLTDSVQNVWQKILIAPSPSSSQMLTLRDVWILDIILIFLMFEFQLFFTLWIERGSFN